jgi:hypothetical protein
MICLDTNAIIAALNNHASPRACRGSSLKIGQRSGEKRRS